MQNLSKEYKIRWLKGRLKKKFLFKKGHLVNYKITIPRRPDVKYTNPMGKAKSIVTLPGITGVNEGPVVDIFTEIYIADVKLIEGAYVRINRSTPTMS